MSEQFLDAIKALVALQPKGKTVCVMLDFGPTVARGGVLTIEGVHTIADDSRMYDLPNFSSDLADKILRALAPTSSRTAVAQARMLVLALRKRHGFAVARTNVGGDILEVQGR